MTNVDYSGLIFQGSMSALILSILELFYFYQKTTVDIRKGLEKETKNITNSLNDYIYTLDERNKEYIKHYINSTNKYLDIAKESDDDIKKQNLKSLYTGFSISILIAIICVISFIFTQRKLEMFSVPNLISYIGVVIAFILYQLYFIKNVSSVYSTVSKNEIQYNIMKSLEDIVIDIEKNRSMCDQ